MPPPVADTDFIYQMAARTRASRIVELRGNNRGSMVGAFVAWLNGGWQTLVFESRHELKIAYILLAKSGLQDLFDQPPRVRFIGLDGEVHAHTFDFLAVINGRRYAVAAKFRSSAERLHFRRQLAVIKSQCSDFADEVLLVTEEDFTKEDALAAELFHFIGRENDPEADALVGKIVSTLTGSATVGSIVAASGLKSRAWRSIVRLVGLNQVNVVGTARIDDYDTCIIRAT